MFRHLLALAGSTVLVLGFAPPTSGAESFQGFEIDPLNWPVSLSGAERFVVEGIATDGGSCSYQYPSVRLSQDDVIYRVRVIGVDTLRCRLLLEEGTTTDPMDPPLGPGYAFETTTASGVTFEYDPLSPLDARKHGRHTVQWVDPILLAVNWVRTDMYWSYDYSCSYSGSTSGSSGWLSQTGWSRTRWSVTQSQGKYCEPWRGQSVATFTNNVFCVGQPATWAYYDYVRVEGWADGSATFTRSTSVSGGCAGLLHMEYSYFLENA